MQLLRFKAGKVVLKLLQLAGWQEPRAGMRFAVATARQNEEANLGIYCSILEPKLKGPPTIHECLAALVGVGQKQSACAHVCLCSSACAHGLLGLVVSGYPLIACFPLQLDSWQPVTQ